jgi:alkanesulfonate monooxygenase SsuD/methylene tetrahydromethanopterin reductase-like flavin-dependent oxidoreductase (luciferase family)
MKTGAFMMPSNPPHRSIRDGHEHNLDYICFLDEMGYDEVWVGEHYTTPWEPCPSPDLLIAQALARTANITMATGAFLLPYHHPAELAQRIAYLDHLAEGRLIVGIGAGGFPGDWQLFDIDGMAGENRDMMAESLEIMVKLWTTREAFRHEGKYWTVQRPADDTPTRFHLYPYQDPHPPIAITSLSPKSPTMALAGSGGYLPVNLGLSNQYLKDNWEVVDRTAQEAGREPNRDDWRLGRDVLIADTDKEARKLALDGPIAVAWGQYLLPLFKQFGLLDVMKHDVDVADSDVTLEYLADHNWIVGSPDTAAEKLATMVEESGGFGCLLTMNYDHLDYFDQWRESKIAFIEEVAPKFA